MHRSTRRSPVGFKPAQSGHAHRRATSGDVGGPGAGDFVFHVRGMRPQRAHELHLATYHMLWELVHIVLNHRGIGEIA